MRNQKEMIDVELGDDNCPADALMANFRAKAKQIQYPKNVEFSESSIRFFHKMSDAAEETENNILFYWEEIEEEDLPPLFVKVRKKEGHYYLQYLKELGEEKTIIKGKQRKGKNKYGKIEIIKEEEEEER